VTRDDETNSLPGNNVVVGLKKFSLQIFDKSLLNFKFGNDLIGLHFLKVTKMCMK
jgi:hypothetical protein